MTVTLPYDPMWRALSWAKKNCPSYITNDVYEVNGKYDATKIVYFFGNDREAMMFLLKWS